MSSPARPMKLRYRHQASDPNISVIKSVVEIFMPQIPPWQPQRLIKSVANPL